MDTADWAFAVSILSVVLAVASFVWSVWSHFIYPRPKISVAASVMEEVGQGHSSRPFIGLHATNYGPNDVTLYLTVGTTRRWFGAKTRGLLLLNPLVNPLSRPDTTGPFTGLPKKVAVGEGYSAYFDISLKLGQQTPPVKGFGFTDTFNRYHLVRGRKLRKFLANLVEAQEKLGLPTGE